MRRLRVIITAICLGIIGAILPMVGALFFAWHLAFNQEIKILYEYTTRMLTRAKYTLDESRKLVPILESQNSIQPICTPEHIAWMSKIASSIMEAKKISYYNNGTELCTSCGVPSIKLPRYQTDFILPDGLEVAIPITSEDSKSVSIALRKDSNYDIFIEPKRLSDIIVPRETWLAIIYDKKIITEQNTINPELLQIILRKLNKYDEDVDEKNRLKPAKHLKKYNEFLAKGRLVSINKYGPFYFIASEPESRVTQSYKNMQLLLLPLGVISAFFIVALVSHYSLKRLSFKAELYAALSDHEFFIHYQPIINTASGECYGAEALIRWERPSGKTIRPDLFIPSAEEIGIISLITERVIDIVFNEMEEVLVQNNKLHISINVSSGDIHNGWILEALESKISKSKIMRNQIWIELTERAYLNEEEVKKVLIKARELGYIIAIDDFGTGYSNLSYLQNLPIDLLKIDKSFIDSLGRNAVTSNVTDHIISIAKSLNLQLIAEGVEQKDQYDYLKEKNVDYIQGYLFSKPLSINQFIQFLQEHGSETHQKTAN